MEGNLLVETIQVEQAAILANLSIKTIRKEVASGSFESDKKNGKIIINKHSFLAWKDKVVANKLISHNKIINQKKKEDIVNWVDVKSEMSMVDGWTKKIEDRYNCIDLFSGAGGLSCGLVMAGFTPVASVEIMPEAIQTYKNNFSHIKDFKENITSSDIRDANVKSSLIESVKNKHIHLISGGFPCQGFSMAGHRIVCDSRNSLYLEMLHIVSEVKPDFIVMENVEGLRSMLNGEIEKKIISDYKNIGYDINVTTLNAADYGVPQTRKRVIFIGNRLGLKNYHPKPFLTRANYKTVKDGIERFLNLKENKEINHIFTKHSKEMLNRMKDLEVGKSLYGNYSDAWKKVAWDKPSCTVKENHGGVNIHPILNRAMSPRELAALQSFPDDFIFYGSKKWQLVQIGNAVPPLLGKAVGLAVIKSLKEKK